MSAAYTTVGVPLLAGTGFDVQGTRFVTPTRTGFACYQGAATAEGWRGILVGLADDQDTIDAFLRGHDVALRRR